MNTAREILKINIILYENKIIAAPFCLKVKILEDI